MSRQPTARQLEKRAEIDAIFRASFEELATKNSGVLGDPNGTPAYAYLRVSTDKQAEDGRGGLPRQLEHVHEIALKSGKRIEWANVYADDASGFEYRRPAIDKLMELLERHGRGQSVVIEYKDRLARDTEYQGMFIKVMERAGVNIVWWQDPGSPLVRRVTSAAEQEYSEVVKARMYDGRLRKARSGRVTNTRAAYGYQFVDGDGEVSEKARKFTYYGIREDQAGIVAELYRRIAAAEPLRQIARDLEARGVPTAKGCKHWYGPNIAHLIRNPVYKGDYFAHRHTLIETAVPSPDDFSTERVSKQVQRPEAEWIPVRVPKIVDAALWQAANDMLHKNRITAGRNNKKGAPFLLGGLVKCATCGYSYAGYNRNPDPKHGHKHMRRGYECRHSTRKAEKCHQRSIVARNIEAAVWKAMCDALLDPDAVVKALEARTYDEQNEQIEREIAQLEAALTTNAQQAARLLDLYMDPNSRLTTGAFNDRQALLDAEAARLRAKLDVLTPQRADAEALELQKQVVEASARALAQQHQYGVEIEPPEDIKRKLLKRLVDRIDLNAREGWFRIEGILRGTYNIANTQAS